MSLCVYIRCIRFWDPCIFYAGAYANVAFLRRELRDRVFAAEGNFNVATIINLDCQSLNLNVCILFQNRRNENRCFAENVYTTLMHCILKHLNRVEFQIFKRYTFVFSSAKCISWK